MSLISITTRFVSRLIRLGELRCGVVNRTVATFCKTHKGMLYMQNSIRRLSDESYKDEDNISSQIMSHSDMDPFGLEEMIGNEDPKLLVEGFYGRKPREPGTETEVPTSAKEMSLNTVTSSPEPVPELSTLKSQSEALADEFEQAVENRRNKLNPAGDPEKGYRLEEYDTWIRRRMMESRDKVGGEHVREAICGTFRLDRDNVVNYHGQYDNIDDVPQSQPTNAGANTNLNLVQQKLMKMAESRPREESEERKLTRSKFKVDAESEWTGTTGTRHRRFSRTRYQNRNESNRSKGYQA